MTPPEADPSQWLVRARGDLHAAEVLLPDPDAPRWISGFHLQQAAEKGLKAVLVARGVLPPRTHNLATLAFAANAVEPTMAGWADRLLTLNEFSVAQRYPGFEATETDPAQAIAWVKELLALVEEVVSRA